jgi:hypothetical protein
VHSLPRRNVNAPASTTLNEGNAQTCVLCNIALKLQEVSGDTLPAAHLRTRRAVFRVWYLLCDGFLTACM